VSGANALLGAWAAVTLLIALLAVTFFWALRQDQLLRQANHEVQYASPADEVRLLLR
jgi:hypothetical protein